MNWRLNGISADHTLINEGPMRRILLHGRILLERMETEPVPTRPASAEVRRHAEPSVNLWYLAFFSRYEFSWQGEIAQRSGLPLARSKHPL